eukprot:TRINITY_DN8929_c0_g1_i1.p1 TRINITY_DN8929_c0_g1~~TRINITY_DN8929_c0_g1_i1.p1  ORF type:complete len:256 (+),score=8.81 TRINITY_DN8929_c0_g1_i1:79-846(+)
MLSFNIFSRCTSLATHKKSQCKLNGNTETCVRARQRSYSSQPKERHLLLLSGGVESTTLLYDIVKQVGRSEAAEKVRLIFFDYAQRGAEMEWISSVKNAQNLGLSVTKFDLKPIGETLRSMQKSKLHVPIMHRNLPILSLAVSFAAQEDVSHIHLGITLDDQQKNYASASIAFVDAYQAMINSLGISIKVETRFSKLSKSQIIQLGHSHGLNYSSTYSCMLGHEKHCGTCMQCKARKQAFIDAGVPEAPDFYRSS